MPPDSLIANNSGRLLAGVNYFKVLKIEMPIGMGFTDARLVILINSDLDLKKLFMNDL